MKFKKFFSKLFSDSWFDLRVWNAGYIIILISMAGSKRGGGNTFGVIGACRPPAGYTITQDDLWGWSGSSWNKTPYRVFANSIACFSAAGEGGFLRPPCHWPEHWDAARLCRAIMTTATWPGLQAAAQARSAPAALSFRAARTFHCARWESSSNKVSSLGSHVACSCHRDS